AVRIELVESGKSAGDQAEVTDEWVRHPAAQLQTGGGRRQGAEDREHLASEQVRIRQPTDIEPDFLRDLRRVKRLLCVALRIESCAERQSAHFYGTVPCGSGRLHKSLMRRVMSAWS